MPALLVAVTESWQMVLWVLALYVLIQQVESNFVTPVVQRRTADLPPAARANVAERTAAPAES